MSNFDLLIWLVPCLPLVAAVFTGIFGKPLLRGKSHWPVIISLAASFVASLILLWQVYQRASSEGAPGGLGYEYVTPPLWTWAAIDHAWADAVGPLRVDVVLRADPLTAVMLAMVTLVSLLVTIYAAGYMHGDKGYWRFFAYIALFVFSMTMLVSVSNFLLLYVFWEAVGVCSYLLIGFWFERPAAAAAGKKAFLVNRVGDFAFALGVFLIWTTFGTLDFHDPVAAGEPLPNGARYGVLGPGMLESGYAQLGTILPVICLLLFVGACGKSAQFPLHVWLPDAMEGPTPVSALIHAATMVTAGVYMVARCAPLFLTLDPWVGEIVAATGAFTAVMAAFIAITQTDLKRILAYSTISQLGFMFLGLGTMTVAGIVAGMFHLFTHAFFKALLFLGAGSVMHAMGNVIDIRQFGGLRRRLPITHATFLIGSLALAGIPPLAGFWSKDGILAAVYDKAHGQGDLADAVVFWALLIVALVTAMLTAFYTFRAFFRTFYGDERIPAEAHGHVHEPAAMDAPLLILALLAAVAGICLAAYSDFVARTPSLAFISRNTAHRAVENVHWPIAVASTAVALVGLAAAWVLYVAAPSVAGAAKRGMQAAFVYQLSLGKLFFDQVYYVLIVWPLKLAAFVFRFLDNFLVDGIVNAVGWLPAAVGAVLRPLQVGLIQFYALATMLGIVVLIGSLLWWY